MTEQTLLALLNHKIELLKNMNDVGVIWWTTTIVFSAAIIGLFWKERQHVKKFPAPTLLKWSIGAFYLTAILFGVWMIYIGNALGQEYNAILTKLNVERQYIDNVAFFGSKVSFGLGVLNLIVIFVLWLRFSNRYF